MVACFTTVAISFLPPRAVRRLFPPMITGVRAPPPLPPLPTLSAVVSSRFYRTLSVLFLHLSCQI